MHKSLLAFGLSLLFSSFTFAQSTNPITDDQVDSLGEELAKNIFNAVEGGYGSLNNSGHYFYGRMTGQLTSPIVDEHGKTVLLPYVAKVNTDGQVDLMFGILDSDAKITGTNLILHMRSLSYRYNTEIVNLGYQEVELGNIGLTIVTRPSENKNIEFRLKTTLGLNLDWLDIENNPAIREAQYLGTMWTLSLNAAIKTGEKSKVNLGAGIMDGFSIDDANFNTFTYANGYTVDTVTANNHLYYITAEVVPNLTVLDRQASIFSSFKFDRTWNAAGDPNLPMMQRNLPSKLEIGVRLTRK